MKATGNFTEGKILAPLLRFALPILLALFLQAAYGAVDLLIVGRFGLPEDVSAVGTGSQIMQSVTFIIIGLAMGTTVLIGQKLGEGRPEQAAEVVGSSIVIFTVVAIVMTAVMLCFADDVATLMNTPEQAFDKTVTYIRICCGGLIFIVAYNLLGSIFRGLGNSRLPLITVAIAFVFNVAGDLLLVAVLEMNAAGAAIATVAAQALSVAISLMIIKKTGLPFAFGRADLHPKSWAVRGVFKLGTPLCLQDFLVTISFLVILAIVNSLGLIASAGLGVAERLIFLLMLVPSAYMSSVAAFVAQNVGAKKFERARLTLRYAIMTSVAVGAVMFCLAFFWGDRLAAIFNTDPGVIAAAFDYLKAYAFDCLLVSFLFCYLGYFNGCGHTVFTMVQGVIAAFAIRVPFAYLMSQTADVTLFKIGLATPVSTVLQIILCAGFYFYTKKLQLQAEYLSNQGGICQ